MFDKSFGHNVSSGGSQIADSLIFYFISILRILWIFANMIILRLVKR